MVYYKSNINNFYFMQQVASRLWDSSGFIRKSNSDVYISDDKRCMKHYFDLEQDTVEKYNLLQELLSHVPISLDLELGQKYDVKPFSLQKKDIFEDNISNEVIIINAINFLANPAINNTILPAWDIESRENIIAQESTFIPGKTLLDVSMNENIDYEKKLYFYNILKWANDEVQKESWVDTTCDNPQDRFQIHGINCKIIDFKYGVLFINITDIARNIWEMVEKNKEKIQEILHNQN